MSDQLPSVSVVIPARDSARMLRRALESVADQTYPNIIETVVAAADGESADVAGEFGATVVDNPTGTTPAALNRAIALSSGEVVVRCDAQARLPSHYVARAVETLMRSGAANVGGMQLPVGETPWEKAIAAAMASPLGAGDARYRIGGEEGPVETVYLGVYRRSALDEAAGFDEGFTRNQDYELNHRIIERGGVVWFDPELKVEYQPRGSLRALARQYFDYGRAKRRFARKHPGHLRWRQLAAPALVVALAASMVTTVFTRWSLVLPLAYIATLVVTGLQETVRHGWSGLGVAPALAVMHLSWGVGFLTSPSDVGEEDN